MLIPPGMKAVNVCFPEAVNVKREIENIKRYSLSLFFVACVYILFASVWGL